MTGTLYFTYSLVDGLIKITASSLIKAPAQIRRHLFTYPLEKLVTLQDAAHLLESLQYIGSLRHLQIEMLLKASLNFGQRKTSL